jgi:phage/plasmid primase-like uncharacterized protein/phage/plasmid-associated DNA primase
MDTNDLLKTLDSQGFSVLPEFHGEIQRLNRDGNLNAWFQGRTLEVNGNTVYIARYGDWKTGEEYEWQSDEFRNDEGFSRAVEQMREEAKAEKSRRQEAASRECESIWARSQPVGSHQYMDRKKLPHLSASRLNGSDLVVSLRDLGSGELTSLQAISGSGQKKFHSGGRIKGCACVIDQVGSDWRGSGKVFIVEGYATGVSVFLAMGKRYPVLCAMNCGNLEAVGVAVRTHCPNSEIIFAADNDAHTEGNPGLTAAREAAARCGGRVVAPIFGSYEGNPTDWNDLHCREGLEKVTAQLEDALTSIKEKTLVPMELQINPKTGKMQLPPQQQVADALLKFYGQDIIKQGASDIFVFLGTHWKHVPKAYHSQFKIQIQTLCNGLATNAIVNAVFELFLVHLPKVPEGRDMFAPKAFLANFKNGTLHAVRDQEYNYSLKFQPHSKEDYLTNMIPLDYAPEKGEKNVEFEKMLDRVFEGDVDRDEKIRAVKQMYGACLIPLFPHLFLLHGQAGSGKSSLIIPAMRLVSQENISGVEPHEFTGFLMESMVGKLVNVVTDIDTTQTMDDANIKKIEDRIPIRIDRKFQTPVYMPLPAVHIFGANELPRTFSGASKAHERRWTFISIEKFQAQGFYNKDFAVQVFDACPGGVLNFALEGLADLLTCRGHFVNPSSGKEKMKEWQLEYDVFGTFFKEIGAGEVLDNNTVVMLENGLQIERKKLWKVFMEWHRECKGFPPKVSKQKLYAACDKLGHRVKAIDGVYYFEGLGVKLTGKVEM